MHGRRTALRYSPSTPSPAGARSRGQSTVLPFGSGWSAPSPSWRVPGGRCVRRVWQHAIRGSRYPTLPYFVIYGTCASWPASHPASHPAARQAGSIVTDRNGMAYIAVHGTVVASTCVCLP
jgi:hypothetical protein